MSKQQRYTDEELTAYLDNEIDPKQRSMIRASLARDASLRARLNELSADTASIKYAFDGILAGAPAVPTFLSDTAPSAARPSRSFTPAAMLAAGAMLCVLFGAAAGWLLKSHRDNSWQMFAATYHALYVNRTLVEVKQERARSEGELTRASDALGKDISLVDIRSVDQLDYKRAQILGFRGRPLIQLAFLSEVGAPIALCIIRSDRRTDSPIEFDEIHDMQAAQWIKDGYEYLLVGGDDGALVQSAAQQFFKRL